ncbi:MAG TPA: response regulator [Vicinamibacterales bacterium]|jgi:DNA-binding response OmpR family regulator|nr:response regulator [Vicinamibacterales bacterium]
MAKWPYRILVIDDDESALVGMSELLCEEGHDVTAAATYDEAKCALAESVFDLLVTDVHLRPHNGLHLVMHTRAEHPDTAIVITTGYDEPAMALEASRYNARFVKKPIRPAEFLKTVDDALSTVRRRRRWPRKRLDSGFRVMADGRPAAVVDVSYGGLRLELPDQSPLPSAFEIEMASIGLQLAVEPVWAAVIPQTGTTICGAALAETEERTVEAWQAIVDRLNA